MRYNDYSATLPASMVTALDVACPECDALEAQACTTDRMSKGKSPVPLLCPGRMALARQYRDSGRLQETLVDTVSSCHRCSWVNGRKIGCWKHRCESAGCLTAAEISSSFCAAHKPGRTSGARLKMTPDRVARMNKMRAEGMTQGAIAKQLGVSQQTVFLWLHKEQPAAYRETQLASYVR